ncbi:unnamed protein product, partial [Brassica rapa]
KQKCFLRNTFIYLDIQKTFHQYLHAYSGPKATSNVVGRICLIQRSDIYNKNTDTKIIIA